jgi:hypothetical protein
MIVENLAEDFGVLADTVEVALAIIMMIGGIWITHLIQRWADKAGEQPPAANTGFGGGYERREERTFRD